MVWMVHTSLSLEKEKRGLGRTGRCLDLQDVAPIGYLGGVAVRMTPIFLLGAGTLRLEQIRTGGQCIQDAHGTSRYLYSRLLELSREIVSWNLSPPGSAMDQGHSRRRGCWEGVLRHRRFLITPSWTWAAEGRD